MQRKTKWIIGGAVAGALMIGGIGTVAAEQATTDDERPLTGEQYDRATAAAEQATTDDERPLTGEQYDRATAAALEETKGGKVTDTETGDDGAAYGVEVLKDDGQQVEVNLDKEYRVMNTEADDDTNEADDDRDDSEPDDD